MLQWISVCGVCVCVCVNLFEYLPGPTALARWEAQVPGGPRYPKVVRPSLVVACNVVLGLEKVSDPSKKEHDQKAKTARGREARNLTKNGGLSSFLHNHTPPFHHDSSGSLTTLHTHSYTDTKHVHLSQNMPGDEATIVKVCMYVCVSV